MLVVKHLSKSFAQVPAIIDASLTIAPGQIHALLGENGAGKSTLMNMIAGLYRPDSGSLTLDGRALQLRSPADALRAGIGMVHQHFKLVPSMTVSENFAAFEASQRFQPKVWAARLHRLGEDHGLQVDPDRRICDLSLGEKQRVEILRLLARKARILILDEPTAILTPHESETLFAALRQLARCEHAVLIVTHKLREVFAVADVLTVLRRGHVVMTATTTTTNDQEVAVAMVGDDVPTIALTPNRMFRQSQAPLLTARDLMGKSLRNYHLDLHAGRITAVVGVSGNGQDELFHLLLGTVSSIRGSLYFGTIDLAGKSIRARQDLGMAFIHPDVRADALLPDMTVAENLILDRISRKPRLNRKDLQKHAATLRERFRIASPSLDTLAGSLSGGNMQKIALARELSRTPQILIAMNPTRGLDLAATAAVHREIRLLAERGAAVLVITEDLDEAYTLADDLQVITRGSITLAGPANEATRESVGLAMGAAAT